MPEPARRRPRTPRLATVRQVSRVTPHLVRLVLSGEGLAGFAPEHADSYVKLVLPPPGAGYRAPFDMEAVQQEHPREHWPVLRTYTVRRWDAAAAELTLDVVVHGDEGVAGPWAVAARPGDLVQLLGPGGAYAPLPEADWHLLAGDETALPAIAAALERLPEGATARVFVEVADAAEEQPLDLPPRVELVWVHRDGRPGAALVDAVRTAGLPAGRVHAFVHGEAGAVRELRRHLRAELAVPRELLSASGYWRLGRTDEGWRAEKADWNAAVEADDQELAAAS
ncbi:siderophore-interacting protein [Geodermatophilus marinus]|uniref:siderophore-interacting protein n=1 Tax=Geodermatophilus sp. LHW52908 TaxID=2303986 RepID=UPI000E3C168A|nr:siderophore-interacting protein [Geodermatophilus sp. LHW52908]RFU20913.1 siderophore-interacting protein [Geodermatophilus sp. LHW52908]